MDEIDIKSNQFISNQMSFSAEQLEQLVQEDKTDNNSYTVGKFSFDTESIGEWSVEGDDDPFSPIEGDTMESPKEFKPRQRRVSDVIDSIGDGVPDSTDSSHSRAINIRGPPASPLSSGYGSVDNMPHSALSTDWQNNPVSPRRALQVPRLDLPDAINTTTDSQPMDQSRASTPSSDPSIATMPVDMYAEEYNMNHKRRGKALILNHDKFDNNTMPPREGSDIDVSNLETTYKALGFEVIIHHNLEYTQIKTVIKDLAKEDHSDADCMIVTILTHGMGSNYLLSKDVPYSVDLLWSSFTGNNCLTLAGKPKIFVIQACRGEKLDPGVILKERRGSRTETDSSASSYKIPTQADFLIAYSSAEGFYSWRNPDKGTWFIQCLCEELRTKAATVDLQKIITHTARRVAIDHESFSDMIPWQHQQKQVPSCNTMLIRDIYFRPKV